MQHVWHVCVCVVLQMRWSEKRVTSSHHSTLLFAESSMLSYGILVFHVFFPSCSFPFCCYLDMMHVWQAENMTTLSHPPASSRHADWFCATCGVYFGVGYVIFAWYTEYASKNSLLERVPFHFHFCLRSPKFLIHTAVVWALQYCWRVIFSPS